MDPVLITGASGLVGYQVALRLHAAGHDVLGLDLRPPPPGTPFRYEAGDVTSLATMSGLLAGRPNLVHAGAISGPMLMRDDPHGVAHVNIGGAMAVFEAARLAKVRRLVWASSIAVYGDQPTLDAVPEDTKPNPQSFYGHTKLAGEALLRGYVQHYGLNAVALRISSVYGVRRQTLCNLNLVIEAALQGRPAPVPAENTSFRQYIHVEDAATAMIAALSAETVPGFVYNITGDTYVSEAAIARMIGEAFPDLVLEPGPPAWNEGHMGPLNIEAAARDLGYRPLVSLRDGLAELIAHLSTSPEPSA
jgi:nucleoside-diphosphate-sugar epimerase